MVGERFWAVALVLVVGACASAPGIDLAQLRDLPVCADNVIGVRQQDLKSRSGSDVIEAAESLGWLAPSEPAEVIVVERDPRLLNNGEVANALVSYYPTDLRDRGLGGSVTFYVWFDPDGNLVRRQIAEGTRYQVLNRAAADVLSVMEFSPATTGSCRPHYWAELVVTFEVQR